MQEVIESLGLAPVPFLEKLTLNHTVDELVVTCRRKKCLE